jgi:hypothetical protein
MQFRNWQIDMLRDGLRAYHALAEFKGSGKYNWNDVKEAIDEHTGTVIPSETLRQFAERFHDPRRGGARSLQPERLTAVYEFLTHEGIGIFKPEEFNETGFDSAVVLALRNALRRKHDKQAAEFFESLPPLWRSVQRGRSSYAMTTLHFEEIGQNQGLFHVTEHHETFNWVIEKIIAGHYDNLPDAALQKHLADDRRDNRAAQGYAIITPEGTLLVFLKERDSTNNRYYVSLFRNQSQESPGEDALAGILHRFAYEAEMDSERADDPAFVAERAFQHVKEGVLLFCPSKDHLFRRFSARFLTPDALPAIGTQLIAMPPPPHVAEATGPDILAEAQERLSQKAADWKARIGRAIQRSNDFIKDFFRRRSVGPPPSAATPRQSAAAAQESAESEARPVLQQNVDLRLRTSSGLLVQVIEEEFRPLQTRLMEAVAARSFAALSSAIADGSPSGIVLDFNARHPDTGETAMHSMAAAGSRRGLRFLFSWAAIKGVPLNHLLRDNRGWLPSKAAYVIGEDPVMGRFLLGKEKQAARKLGVALHWIDPDPAAWNQRVRIPPLFEHHS